METSPHVLVVDDHRDIREPLARYLEKHDVRVTLADGSAAARRALQTAAVDLVVLDIMMPGEDGLALCRHLRETTRIPVILLTAMTEDTDRVVGLEIGADDYVHQAVQSPRAAGPHQGGDPANAKPAARSRTAFGAELPLRSLVT